jgi:hypothetical protein
LVTDKTVAAEPPVVVPATYSEPAPPEPEIERFHGTVKVNPVAPPAPAMRPPMVEMTPPMEPPIVQVEARNVAPLPPDTRVSDAVVDTLQAVREDTRRVSTSAAVLLGQMGGWLKAPPAEPRAIGPTIPITITYPAPVQPATPPAYYPQIQPWMTTLPSAPVAPLPPISQVSATTQPFQPPPQPTIIVLHEPAPAPVAVPAPVAPVYVTAPAPAPLPASVVQPERAPESLLGFGVGVAGLGIGLASWFRSSRQKRAETESPKTAATTLPTPAAPPLDGVILAGGLYAGPRPELAEPFDLGPSYEDEQLAKKKLESENQNAVLEFILSQNLALHAAFAEPSVDEAPSELAGSVPVAD